MARWVPKSTAGRLNLQMPLEIRERLKFKGREGGLTTGSFHQGGGWWAKTVGGWLVKLSTNNLLRLQVTRLWSGVWVNSRSQTRRAYMRRMAIERGHEDSPICRAGWIRNLNEWRHGGTTQGEKIRPTTRDFRGCWQNIQTTKVAKRLLQAKATVHVAR